MFARIFTRVARPAPRLVAQGTRGIVFRALIRRRINPNPIKLAPLITLDRLRQDNALFNALYRLYERTNKTKKLIRDISTRIRKLYPFQGSFLLNDKEGRKVEDFTLGRVLGKGCNGVAFAAQVKKDNNAPDFDMSDEFQKESEVVVKQMFNYSAHDTNSIFSAFQEEELFNKDEYSKRKLIHPFIMPIERKFTANFVDHPQKSKYREACPDRSGMDRTLYLVSRKMDSDLNGLFKVGICTLPVPYWEELI